MKKIHIKSFKDPVRFLCGLKRATIPTTCEEMCARCEAIASSRDRKDEEIEERLIKAGVLEPNYGPNDQRRRE
jgi:hypothetical protein